MTRRELLVGAGVIGALGPARISYIELNEHGALTGVDWPQADVAVSLGSLLKPFVALSYLATHARGPVVYCRGKLDGCWFGPGHGRKELAAALSNSCNAYFQQLAADVDRSALEMVSLHFGLVAPASDWSCSRLIGEGEGWPQSPVTAAAAFALLAREVRDPNVELVLRGMELCSTQGTARGIGRRCYAKTGTAPCAHTPRGSGDGFAVAMLPAGDVRRIVLASRHNAPGASVAQELRVLIEI